MEMTLKPIIYAEVGAYKNLSCRAVISDNGRTGEFHVRSLTQYPIDDLMQALRGIIDNAEIGPIGLDYDVYIKSESVLTTDGIEEFLKQADEFIERICSGK